MEFKNEFCVGAFCMYIKCLLNPVRPDSLVIINFRYLITNVKIVN
jgi:hypothetical protein